jgi:hypothetical protein
MELSFWKISDEKKLQTKFCNLNHIIAIAKTKKLFATTTLNGKTITVDSYENGKIKIKSK